MSRRGGVLAPRFDFDNEVTSQLKAGQFDAALTLLKQQSPEPTFLNKLDRSGLALIHVACASGAMEFLVELISLGAEISLPASSGSTALHFAAINNRKGIIEVLLRSGADPSIPDMDGKIAGELTSDPDIQNTLSRDSSQTLKNGAYGYGISAINQARQSLKVYAENNENLSCLGLEKLSIEDGDPKKVSFDAAAIKHLSSTGADLLSPISMDQVSGSTTQQVRSAPVANTASNVSISDSDLDDYTPEEYEDKELRRLLLRAVLQACMDTASATQNVGGSDDRRKIAELCQNTKSFARDENKLKKWLSFDPSLAICRADNLQNLAQDGFTPLHIAAKSNNIAAMKLLLQQNAVSTWAVDLQGRTPLHIAAGEGHKEACDFLREKMFEQSGGLVDPIGANAPVDLTGITPVGWAAVCTKRTGSGKSISSIMKTTLFEAGDKTVLPLTPIRQRVGTSPRRNTQRIDRISGGTITASEAIVYAFSLAQGWKPEMEDKVITMSPVSGVPHWSFFALCDGHGGDFVANYLRLHLAEIISRTASELEAEIGTIDEDSSSDVLEKVLLRACCTADHDMSKHPRMLVEKTKKKECEDDSGSTGLPRMVVEKITKLDCKDESGSTGLLCVVSKKHIAVANVGDSRALLAQWGSTPLGCGSRPGPSFTPQRDSRESSTAPPGVLVASALSVDHKYSLASERDRAALTDATVAVIAGADTDPDAPEEFEVYTRKYKNGATKLRMSRSFGDFYMKQFESLPAEQQAVIAVPDIVIFPRSVSDAFVLLACDGVYDVMSNQEIVDLLAYNLGYSELGPPAEGFSMTRCAEACDALLKECVRRDAHDNLSALIIMCGESSEKDIITAQNTLHNTARKLTPPLMQFFPESSLNSPDGASTLLGSPSSGARDRTPTDKTLSRVFATQSPGDPSAPSDYLGDPSTSVNRHLEFARELM